MKTSPGAASYRAYYDNVPAEVREEIYLKILSCEVNGDANAFESLTVLILAYTASGRLYPEQSKACHDLLALISHSIISRKTQTTSVTLTAQVTQTLAQAKKLKKAAEKKLPDYGNLDSFLEKDKTPERVIIDAEELPPKPTRRLTRG